MYPIQCVPCLAITSTSYSNHCAFHGSLYILSWTFLEIKGSKLIYILFIKIELLGKRWCNKSYNTVLLFSKKIFSSCVFKFSFSVQSFLTDSSLTLYFSWSEIEWLWLAWDSSVVFAYMIIKKRFVILLMVQGVILWTEQKRRFI
jgi:hypothetical protein